MRLTVFNGSPRGKSGNTKVFLEHFLKGFTETQGNKFELHYLLKEKDPARLPKAFADAETVLLAFPLYIDSMPAMVKDFIEALKPYCGREKNPDILFLIQSGFPEAVHLRALERYLEKLSRRLGCRHIGTIIKGGGEGIRFLPGIISKMIFCAFSRIGKTYGATGSLDRCLLTRMAYPERLNKLGLLIVGILQRLGTMDSYWNRQLRMNGAYERRFDTPYLK